MFSLNNFFLFIQLKYGIGASGSLIWWGTIHNIPLAISHTVLLLDCPALSCKFNQHSQFVHEWSPVVINSGVLCYKVSQPRTL